MEAEISDETKEVARRTIASCHILKDNIEKLLEMEIGTTRHRELVAAYKAILLAVYQFAKEYTDI